MDESDSHDIGLNGSHSSSKRPMKSFMFIDSSVQGTNAKPNKAVRSFVMHQARRQKPWSTRQKRSTSHPESNPEVRPKANPSANPVSSPSQTHIEVNDASLVGPGRWREIGVSPAARNDVYHLSEFRSPPVSSSCIGGIPNWSHSQSRSTPPSTSHGRLCEIPYCTGAFCCQMHLTHAALERRDGFALGVLDPFDSLPVRTDPKMESLIDHFVNNISPRLIPVDVHQLSNIATTQWVGNSLVNATSAPFTYAILTSSALHLQALGAAALADVLYYKWRAISEINILLSDDRACTDDNNIAAVFMLLCLEESQLAPGNKEHDNAEWSELQRSIHLSGLRTMIKQRGGLAALSSNSCLQVFVLMHSVAHAISTFQLPYATLTDSSGNPSKYDFPSFRPCPSTNRTLWLFRDLKPCPDLFDIISNIIVFTDDMVSWFKDRRCPVDPLELQKHASLLMYRLIEWFLKLKDSEEEERSAVDQSLCLGLLIFMAKASQPYDPSSRAMILTTVKKLRASLTKASIFRWAASPTLLLWTLTMGALAAQGSAESAFFAKYCGVAFVEAGFDEKTNAEELLDGMRKGLWMPMLFDEEVKRLWVQMGIVRGKEEERIDEGLINPDIKEEEVVGLLTSTRFFSVKG